MTCTVRIPAVAPDESVYAGREVRITLDTGSRQPGWTGDTHVMGPTVRRLPLSGDLSVELIGNVGPMEGTRYVVRIGDPETAAGYVKAIQLPESGSFDLMDPAIATDEPAGVQYVPGPPGVVAAAAPVTYDAEAQEVGIDLDVTGAPPSIGLPSSSIERVEDGDLWLAAGNRVATPGKVEGGVIRQATSLFLPWHYTQTTQPTDMGIGSAVNAQWNAVINSTDAWGARAQTSSLGPRATFNTEGILRYGESLTALSLAPIAFADLAHVGNVSGEDIDFNHAWSVVAAPLTFAQDGKIVLQTNDTNWGGAELAATPGFVTTDGGEIDGLTNGVGKSAVLARLYLRGNVSLHHRYGLEFRDTNGVTPLDAGVGQGEGAGPVTNYTGIPGESTLGNFDALDGVVEEQVAVWIEHLDFGVKNAGILNGSTLVNSPVAAELDAAGDSIRSDASTVHVAAASALTLTSTPTIDAPQWDGQQLTLVNVGAHAVVLRDESLLTDSGLHLVTKRRHFAPGEALTLTAVDGEWREPSPLPSWIYAFEQPGVISSMPADGIRFGHQLDDGYSYIHIAGNSSNIGIGGSTVAASGLGAAGFSLTDGTDAVNGTYYTRTGAGQVRIASLFGTLHTLTAHFAYAPDEAGDWDDPPTTVAAALDELAARNPGVVPVSAVDDDYTLTAADVGGVVACTNTAPMTVTVPTSGLPVGAVVEVIATDNPVVIEPTSPSVLVVPGVGPVAGAVINAAFGTARLRHILDTGPDLWVVDGDVEEDT